MVILLEGPDGAGKSTLYNKLCELYKYNFIKHLPRESVGHYLWWQKKIESPFLYFIDRGFISELVYRPIKADDTPNISLEEIGNLCTNNLCIVYCETEKAYDNMKRRGDDYINDKKEHDMIRLRYGDTMTTLSWFTDATVVTYDFTKARDFVNLVKEIDNFIEEGKKRWNGQQTK